MVKKWKGWPYKTKTSLPSGQKRHLFIFACFSPWALFFLNALPGRMVPLKWRKIWCFFSVYFGTLIHTSDLLPFRAIKYGYFLPDFFCSFWPGNQLGKSFPSEGNYEKGACFLEYEIDSPLPVHPQMHWSIHVHGYLAPRKICMLAYCSPMRKAEPPRNGTCHSCSCLTLLGDKGLLLHSFADETIEEFAELFIYLSLLYFSKLYKALTSTVYIKTAEYSPL